MAKVYCSVLKVYDLFGLAYLAFCCSFSAASSLDARLSV